MLPHVPDAAKVTCSALQNAAPIAALFLTTEAVIADAADSPAGGMPGGMEDFDPRMIDGASASAQT
ncbi:MAG: hypothetical protein U0P45_03795 [Acidimicrobiales bacterium]